MRRGPDLAQAISEALANPSLGSAALAQRGWQALWPIELVLRHQLYQFGLGRLMGFNEALLRTHFATFFSLPREEWFGFLTNTLPLPRLMGVMLRLFALIPLGIAAGIGAGGGEGSSAAFLRSFRERPDPSVEGVVNIHASLI